MVVELKGFVRDLEYKTCLMPTQLKSYRLVNFDVNQAQSYGIIELDSAANNLAFATWVSPKKSRSYPFAMLYDIYHFNSKRIAIIPIIKDEGKGTQNNDHINYIIFSWMNLLNIYIILAWYERAEPIVDRSHRITDQQFNADYVREKLETLSAYHLSALHWNTSHFQTDFEPVYLKAVESYRQIAQQHSVEMHSFDRQIKYLERCKSEGKFDLDTFKAITLKRSLRAAQRETGVSHRLEKIGRGSKAVLSISNYLGGIYHLAPDAIYAEGDTLIIQESKNSSKGEKLPSETDIKDGLFKLILYCNLHQLILDNQEVIFRPRLTITGNLVGQLSLPSERNALAVFCHANGLAERQSRLVELLNMEAMENPRLSIVIGEPP